MCSSACSSQFQENSTVCGAWALNPAVRIKAPINLVSTLWTGCLSLIHDMKAQATWTWLWLGKSRPDIKQVNMAMNVVVFFYIMLLTHVIITPSLRLVWSIADFIKILEVSNFPMCLYGRGQNVPYCNTNIWENCSIFIKSGNRSDKPQTLVWWLHMGQ